MCGRYYLGESEETSFWVDRTMQSSLVKEAHKFVVLACLVLTFLKEEPMHPKDKVQYRVVGHDGIKEYFCPAKTDGVICNYCVAKKLEIQ